MASLHVRRATVDDLSALRALWTHAGFSADELEARMTEFQVVESDGAVVGALGVQVVRQHLRFHSEDYTDFSVADAARELFWARIQKLASNHGVFRAWTQETSPFWTHWGFQPASADQLERLPAEWRELAGRWLTLELKNEDAINEAMNTRFAGFMDQEKKQTAQVAEHARRLKLLITIAGFAIFFICLGLAAWLLLHRPVGSP
jgi:N-acetylglutamate synthase-like GNAT family acetyltransferase